MTPANGKPSYSGEIVPRTAEQFGTEHVQDEKRREIIKKIAVGSAALAGCSILPQKWTTPLIEFGVLPAHASTSALIQELADAIAEEAAKVNELDPELKEEEAGSPEQAETSSPTEEKTPATPEAEAEWSIVHWGGDPNETSESRDRTWWTKIHGSACDHWHRKFPLPGWVDDTSHRLLFEFSDRTTFTVENSTRMQMHATGPKYVPEEPGESDPSKQHPKIGAKRGATPVWVRFREI